MQIRLTGQGNTFTANAESTDNESPREYRVTNYSLGAGLSFFQLNIVQLLQMEESFQKT